MLDRDLDRIAILLLKLSKNDKYKDELEKEYRNYREILEFIPREERIPDSLTSSVFYFEQRLVNYIVLGRSNNPLVLPNPTMTILINDDNDKKKVIECLPTNISFVTSKRQQIRILMNYLTSLDLDNIDIDNVKTTLEIIKNKYAECLVYSNELEQEIAKVQYHLILALIYANRADEARAIIQSFDTDMSLFIHTRHINTIDRLLRENRAESASMLYNFLNDYKSDKIHDLDFWISLAKIEDENFAYTSTEHPKQIDEDNEEQIEDEFKAQEKEGFWSRFLNNNFKKSTIECFYIPKESITITFKLLPNFTLLRKDFNSFVNFMKRITKKKVWLEVKKIIINCEASNLKKEQGTNNVIIELRFVLNRICDFLFEDQMIDLINLREYETEKTIPEEMFSGIRVKKIQLNPFTERIGKSAFEGCFYLESVTGLGSILYIGDRAFLRCKRIEQLDFRKSSYSIIDETVGNEAFSLCEALTQVVGLNDITIIKKRTFYGCKNLKSIECERVKIIEEEAFFNCYSLSKVNWSNNVISIGDKAFFNCIKLSSFNFSIMYLEEDFHIGVEAFAHSGLKNVYIDNNKVCIGANAFKDSCVVKVQLMSIKELSQGAFMECESLVEVRLPDEVETIPSETFKKCINLRNVFFSHNIIEIGANCFEECRSLVDVELPKSTESLGEGAFKSCSSLRNFSANSLREIPDEAFYDCSSLEKVEFKVDSISEIGTDAFNSCRVLHDFVFPTNLRKIGNRAFALTKLEKVKLPDTLYYLGEAAFYSCDRLTSVGLSRKISVIGNSTFEKCIMLNRIDFSDMNISAIGQKAFAGCEMLEEICFDGCPKEIGKDCFTGCCSIRSIVARRVTTDYNDKDKIHSEFISDFLTCAGLLRYFVRSYETLDSSDGYGFVAYVSYMPQKKVVK